jgi:hypothetical protein
VNSLLPPMLEPRQRTCHLVEVTAMPNMRYSLILGSLQSAAQTDQLVAGCYAFGKHVLFQSPDLMKALPEWVAGLPRPDVVALSVYFWNRAAVMVIAREVKRHWPSCVVIVGGNDVSYQMESVFAEPAIDVLIHGEGEHTFRNVLHALAEGPSSLSTISGISFRDNGEVATTAPAGRITDLAELPSPLLSGVYSAEDIAASRMIIMETNRGCPYSCAFCYWGGATKSKVRPFPLDRVKQEISYVAEHASTHATLFIADANFGILPRDIEIAEWLVAELQRHNKKLFLYTNWAKNTNKRVVEAAKLLFSHRLIAAVTLSAQSFTPEVLEIAQRSNIRTPYYHALQKEFQEHGIPTYTELIWGLPGESLQSHLASVEEVIDAGGHPVIYPLLLLNNTEYTTTTFRSKHEVLTRMFPYQVTNPEMEAEFVVAHAMMTEDDWKHGLDIRLALALFHGCLMRAPLHYLAKRSGIRVVDLVDRLVGYLRDRCSDQVIRDIVANHRVTWDDPGKFDAELVSQYTGTDGVPEHPHYQAVIHRLARQRTSTTIMREAAEILYFGMSDNERPTNAEFEAVLEFQAVVLECLESGVTNLSRSKLVTIAGWLHDFLVETGQIHAAGVQDGQASLVLDSSSLAEVPNDTMLLGIYHGSVQVTKALQLRAHDAQRGPGD